MPICSNCGFATDEGEVCGNCRSGQTIDEYSPPESLDTYYTYTMPTDTEAVIQPWEKKRWRIDGFSWLVLWLSVFLPPLGFFLSFFAIHRANRFKKRPGNRAVAYSSLGVSLYMAFMIFYMLVLTGGFSSSELPPDPAYESADNVEELNKLLSQ